MEIVLRCVNRVSLNHLHLSVADRVRAGDED